MDRRRFLLGAGCMAAGTAAAGCVTGCGGGSELSIPCIGPAAAPSPVVGVTYIRASEIGCALDCDLRSGRNKKTGGKATDDGPTINAAMAGATAAHPITLIIDGSALISGLFLPAAGHWAIAGLGCGTGFFVKSGINNDGIHNGAPDAAALSDPGPPAPARGANVSLANFTLNGNQGDGHSGVSTTGSHQGTAGRVWYFGINLMNLDGITVQDVVVVNTPSYHIRFSNVGHVAVSGCVLKSHGASTDGLHFDGPANDIAIAKCDFTTGDDAIALNCPEGYSGDIARVTVSDCTFDSWSLMRLYTANYGRNFGIDAVTVMRCSGTLDEAAFLIGLSPGSNPNSVASLTVTDCNVSAPTVLALAENFGTITLTNVIFTPSRAGVVFVRSPINRDCALARSSPLYGDLPTVGSRLVVDGCTISRNQDIKVAALILENDSKIDSIEFHGLTIEDAKTYPSQAQVLNLGSAAVGQLVIESLDSAHMQAPGLPEALAKVAVVSGTGVLATNWQFPDGVMANEVPYISATTGRPSIKVGGVVEPYSPS